MTTNDQTKTRLQKATRWMIRIGMVIGVLCLVLIGVLKAVESSKEPLRQGLQDYLSQVTGHRAEITDLKEVHLFPNVHFHATGLVVRDTADPKKIIMTAKDGIVETPFWRMFMGVTGYHEFSVSDLTASADYFLPARLEIDKLAIGNNQNAVSAKDAGLLRLQGRYNTHPLDVSLSMKRRGEGDKFLYSISNSAAFTFTLGILKAQARIERGWTHTEIKNLSFERGKAKGLFNLIQEQANPFKMSGSGDINGHPATLDIREEAANGGFSIIMKTNDLSDAQKKEIEGFAKALQNDLKIGEETVSFVLENTASDKEKDTEE